MAPYLALKVSIELEKNVASLCANNSVFTHKLQDLPFQLINNFPTVDK